MESKLNAVFFVFLIFVTRSQTIVFKEKSCPYRSCSPNNDLNGWCCKIEHSSTEPLPRVETIMQLCCFEKDEPDNPIICCPLKSYLFNTGRNPSDANEDLNRNPSETNIDLRIGQPSKTVIHFKQPSIYESCSTEYCPINQNPEEGLVLKLCKFYAHGWSSKDCCNLNSSLSSLEPSHQVKEHNINRDTSSQIPDNQEGGPNVDLDTSSHIPDSQEGGPNVDLDLNTTTITSPTEAENVVQTPASTANLECGIKGTPFTNFILLPNGTSQVFLNNDSIKEASWPWMVLLGKIIGDNRTEYFCDGVLVNSLYVLTAAYCVPTQKTIPFIIRLGEHDYESTTDIANPFNVDIESITIHPKYKPSEGYYDLALLKLVREINIKTDVRPICLPPFDSDLVGRNAIITSWRKKILGGTSNPVLQEDNIQVIDSEECQKSYSKLAKFQSIFPKGINLENSLCSRWKKGRNIGCEKDSGGPLIYVENGKWTLGGIISEGHACGHREYPGRFTPIRNLDHLQWIKDVAFAV